MVKMCYNESVHHIFRDFFDSCYGPMFQNQNSGYVVNKHIIKHWPFLGGRVKKW